ncbi:MAG: YcaO-like family protein [Halobellus sp.]|uniref:YcaO-like family protein n=1 Tax=Halobellus sp. TaxID=1979212 RepID=UPI0035D3DFB0
MTHVIEVVGTGPAAEAARAAFTDIDAETRADPDDPALTLAIAPAGRELDAVQSRAERLVTVEIGGLGGHPITAVDAGVSVFGVGSPDFADLRTRVGATTESSGSPSGDRSAVRFAGALAGRRGVALLAGSESVAGTAVEVAGTGIAAERPILAVPDPESRDRELRRGHRTVGVDDALGRAEQALDDRTGIVTQVGEQESFPVPYYLAQTVDTSTFSETRAAEFAAGVDPDWDVAFMKALGEGLERYCAGVYHSAEFTVAPERTRSRPVPPSAFVRPDDTPSVAPETPLPWVDGVDLQRDERVSLPAEFVHYPPPTEQHKPAITTGLGLGNCGTEALLSGLYEVIERDATMLAWYSSYEPLALSVSDDHFQELRKRARAEALTVTTLLVTQDVDVPVVVAAVHRDGEWPRFAVGSDASLHPVAAARSALAEALQNWTELRSMEPEQASAEGGAIGEYATFPEAARSFVEAEATVPAASVGPESVPDGAGELDAVVERIGAADLETYAARLTTADVESLGFEAVRVLVPTAQPLFQGDPFFGARARTVPTELGFEAQLDRPYHPFP